MFSRWSKITSRNNSSKHKENHDSVRSSNSSECYACKQTGAPIFHSTRYNSTNQPQWEAMTEISSLVPPKSKIGKILDPRSKKVQKWNRAVLVAHSLALAVDPLFFYILSIGIDGKLAFYVDVKFALVLTLLRTMLDVVHLKHMLLQFKLAYVPRESMAVGWGRLVWDSREIAAHYLRSLKGFWFDAFVILPIPQIVFWVVLPLLIREQKLYLALSIFLAAILFQWFPKVYHSICMMRKMREVTGYIFGTISWAFGLNLLAYFIASHIMGACWYALALQRVVACLQRTCLVRDKCSFPISCSGIACELFSPPVKKSHSLQLPSSAYSLCMDITNTNSTFNYGIYQFAVPIISSSSIDLKILYPLFWGFSQVCSMGNMLIPSSHWLELIFSTLIVVIGIFLFTLFISIIQDMYLSIVLAQTQQLQLRNREMEWWMSRRHLPLPLRERVRQYEKQRMVTLGGQDEIELIQDLPDGLRREIKRYICIDLIKKVPLFRHLDDLILDNIGDRVKHLLFSKDEKIIREGDPVQRMVFIVRGRIESHQSLSKGMVSTSVLEPGGFFGDELLTWCLRRPFMDRLPPSTATFVCVKSTEAFALYAKDLRYITDHFRYQFASERLKRTARYYSSNWRTWAAVKIQLAWRRYRKGTAGLSTNASEIGETDPLLKYASVFLSLRPHDHLD